MFDKIQTMMIVMMKNSQLLGLNIFFNESIIFFGKDVIKIPHIALRGIWYRAEIIFAVTRRKFIADLFQLDYYKTQGYYWLIPLINSTASSIFSENVFNYMINTGTNFLVVKSDLITSV